LSPLWLISPAHTLDFFGDLPAQVKTEVSDFVASELPEIDSVHVWTRLGLVQNLIQRPSINRVVFHGPQDLALVQHYLQRHQLKGVRLVTWEETNQALVWSLKLENGVMIFLFVAMTFLVAIAITAGFLIFFDKIKRDLTSFWVLGSSLRDTFRLTSRFCYSVSLASCLLGLLVGWLFLLLVEGQGQNIMPSVFVERDLPILITWRGLAVSF